MAALTKLYCPECGNYLEGGDGENHDCPCGWTQPDQVSDLACGGCGNERAEYVTICPHCSNEKCDICDGGDDVECGNCESCDE